MKWAMLFKIMSSRHTRTTILRSIENPNNMNRAFDVHQYMIWWFCKGKAKDDVKLCWYAGWSGISLYVCSLKVHFLIARIKWASSNEKVPSNMRKMRRYRSFGARARYLASFYCPSTDSAVSNDSVSGHWSFCANPQADLGPRCRHMPEDLFSNGAT